MVVSRSLVTTAAASPNGGEQRFVGSAFGSSWDDLCSMYAPLDEHPYAQAVLAKPLTIVECR